MTIALTIILILFIWGVVISRQTSDVMEPIVISLLIALTMPIVVVLYLVGLVTTARRNSKERKYKELV